VGDKLAVIQVEILFFAALIDYIFANAKIVFYTQTEKLNAKKAISLLTSKGVSPK
jgi:hypothetical protein